MTTLVVQIPCLNESESLPAVLKEIPRAIPGVDRVLVLVIDDGSEDGTADVARQHGADRIVRFPRNRGLAVAYSTGLETALEMGADVLVNTDGDGQYPGTAIPELIKPILEQRADIVIGDRRPGTVEHFSPLKRILQRFGNFVVRQASGTEVRDAASGFRAMSRDAALRLNVMGEFTYTMETLIQAGRKNLTVVAVPITARAVQRPSRLFRSMPEYLMRAGASIVRMYTMYRPLPAFMRLGSLFLFAAFLIGVRFLWYWLHGGGEGKVQSLILATILTVIGIQTFLLALIADLIATNRRLSEEVLLRLRRRELSGSHPSHEAPGAGAPALPPSPAAPAQSPQPPEKPLEPTIEVRA